MWILAQLNVTALPSTIISQQDKEQGSCCISEHASWSTLKPWRQASSVDATRHPKHFERWLERKSKKERKHREQKSHTGSQQEVYSGHREWMANLTQLRHCHPLCSNLASSYRPSMPSASPRSLTLSAQQANTLACSPIPLQEQPAAHSGTHHTQKFTCSSSWGSAIKDYQDDQVTIKVDLNMRCDKGKWIHQIWLHSGIVMDLSYSDRSIISPFPPVCLPDFELSKLRLSPWFRTVDLGKVKSVRLKVDVHGLHTQQTHRSALPDYKNGKMSVFIFSAAFLQLESPLYWIYSLTLW